MAIVSADQRETMVHSNEVFRADIDGVFMGLGRYQRYRRAVADRIQETETQTTK
jgi:cytochrome oxidase Cu insertion factor (SCO1/SenC/PrrC family)